MHTPPETEVKTSSFFENLDQWEVSQDFLEATGVKKKLAVRVGRPPKQQFFRVHPEHSLVTLLVEQGRDITLMRSVDDLVSKLEKAAGECRLSKRHADRMNTLIARIQKEHENRNAVAHGIWGVREKKWSLLRYRKPDLVKLGRAKRMTARDLQQIANRIATLTRDFERWLDALPNQ